MPFSCEEEVAMFIAVQEEHETETEVRCGEFTHWCIHDSCDAAIDEYLANPSNGIRFTTPGGGSVELTQHCLLMSLRTKVLALCRGSA